MKKMMMVLLTFVMCLSSFNGMGQDNIQDYFNDMLRADLNISKRLFLKVKDMSESNRDIYLNELREMYSSLEEDNSLYNDENFMNSLSNKIGFTNFTEYQNAFNSSIQYTNLFLSASNYLQLSEAEQKTLIDENTNNNGGFDVLVNFTGDEGGGGNGFCRDLPGFLKCSALVYAGVFTCKLKCIEKFPPINPANGYSITACAGICEIAGATGYYLCFNRYCK
jgi:hypothetical protein